MQGRFHLPCEATRSTLWGGGRTLRAELRERREVSNRQLSSVRKCSGSVRCVRPRSHRVSAPGARGQRRVPQGWILRALRRGEWHSEAPPHHGTPRYSPVTVARACLATLLPNPNADIWPVLEAAAAGLVPGGQGGLVQ
jgi:hypothetical protein